MFKSFVVETPGAAIDTRHSAQSATVRKIGTIVDIIAQKAATTKNKTVVFEKYETVAPERVASGKQICSRMINGSPFAYIDGANSVCDRRMTGIESWVRLAYNYRNYSFGYMSSE